MGKTKVHAKKYLKFTSIEDATFQFATAALEYSLDNGITWSALPAATSSPTVEAGKSILWRGNFTNPTTQRVPIFSSTGKFNAEGDPRSIYYGDNFEEGSLKNDMFYKMFYGCTNLISAKDILFTDSIAGSCYMRMFEGCTSLIDVPNLPATIMATNCYTSMFSGCTALTVAPELPATTLAASCYESMFYGCTFLISAPELPAINLQYKCYTTMFYGCTNLVNITEYLPATILKDSCYYNMFANCKYITKTPIMSPTVLESQCCFGMFNGCTRLTTIRVELPATTLAYRCYWRMFQDTAITTTPELPALTLADSCYSYMFSGCKSVNYIKAMFTTTPSNTYTQNWVYGVATIGTFVMNSAASWSVVGTNGVPRGWTVETSSS